MITATPGVTLNMNSNIIVFSNNGAGLVWGNNYSQIYDDGNLHINTDDYIYISAPTQFNVTTPTASFSGNIYMGSNLLASQSWVLNQFNSPTFTSLYVNIDQPIKEYWWIWWQYYWRFGSECWRIPCTFKMHYKEVHMKYYMLNR